LSISTSPRAYSLERVALWSSLWERDTVPAKRHSSAYGSYDLPSTSHRRSHKAVSSSACTASTAPLDGLRMVHHPCPARVRRCSSAVQISSDNEPGTFCSPNPTTVEKLILRTFLCIFHQHIFEHRALLRPVDKQP
jgi:hypothetical protein